jgi:hypothetical protein
MRGAYKDYIINLDGKNVFRIHTRRCEDSIKTNLRNEFIWSTAESMLQAGVNTIMNFWVP